jgi:hypothetical protein
MKVFPVESPAESTLDKVALPNDPLFLMAPSTNAAPYDKKPMFKLNAEIPFPITLADGTTHSVMIRSSLATKEARQPKGDKKAGSLPHGIVARKNQGVSILREERELKMSSTLVNFAEERNRWWGIEIDFPASLDEVMGVTTNKQSAIQLDAAAEEFKRLLGLGEREPQKRIDELNETDDSHAALLGLWNEIHITMRNMITSVKEINVGLGKGRHGSIDASKAATDADRELTREGSRKTGESDSYVSQGEDKDVSLLGDAIEGQGVDAEVARRVAVEAFGAQIKFVWVEAPLKSSAFFETSPQAGKLLITINRSHPAFQYLISLLDSTPDEVSPSESAEGLVKKLDTANFALKLLLMAWARLEDEAGGEAKDHLQETREDWGRISRKFLTYRELDSSED